MAWDAVQYSREAALRVRRFQFLISLGDANTSLFMLLIPHLSEERARCVFLVDSASSELLTSEKSRVLWAPMPERLSAEGRSTSWLWPVPGPNQVISLSGVIDSRLSFSFW